MTEVNSAGTISPRDYVPGSELLLEKLDNLLIDYLNLLDEHQKTRETMASNLSLGFLSLAQANFSSNSRARYGQDFYDERMQALRTVDIETTPRERAYDIKSVVQAKAAGKAAEKEQSQHEDRQAGSAHGKVSESSSESSGGEASITDEAQNSNSNTKYDEKMPQNEHKEVKHSGHDEEPTKEENIQSRDPIRWFGILVPQALRTAQNRFVDVVENQVGRMATLDAKMMALEIEIRRTRKQLGKIK